MNAPTVQVQVRLPKSVAQRLKEVAKTEMRSISAQIALFIVEGLKELSK